mgnify:CR=1 FL=1
MGTPVAGGAVASSIHTFYSRDAWIEGRAEDQLKDVSSWKGMKTIAAFPDLHPGRFGPVGSAFLSDRIYPQLVGSDIGCGISVFRLSLQARKLKLDKASRRMRSLEDDYDPQGDLPDGYFGELSSLGTIGSGNHFCEIQSVQSCEGGFGISPGDLLLMVHTGSRGYGYRLFREIEDKWNEGFEAGSPEALRYLDVHNKALEYARTNRMLVATRAARALGSDLSLLVDTPHNFLSRSSSGWLHRKGAAPTDMSSLVPLAGSRDSLSYLIKPNSLAPAESLASMAHGAGRKYDRASMHGRLRSGRSDLEALSRNPYGGRVICEDKSLLLEEAGVAYKSSQDVVRDLERHRIGTSVAELRPLLTYKKAITND